MAYVNKGLI